MNEACGKNKLKIKKPCGTVWKLRISCRWSSTNLTRFDCSRECNFHSPLVRNIFIANIAHECWISYHLLYPPEWKDLSVRSVNCQFLKTRKEGVCFLSSAKKMTDLITVQVVLEVSIVLEYAVQQPLWTDTIHGIKKNESSIRSKNWSDDNITENVWNFAIILLMWLDWIIVFINNIGVVNFESNRKHYFWNRQAHFQIKADSFLVQIFRRGISQVIMWWGVSPGRPWYLIAGGLHHLSAMKARTLFPSPHQNNAERIHGNTVFSPPLALNEDHVADNQLKRFATSFSQWLAWI